MSNDKPREWWIYTNRQGVEEYAFNAENVIPTKAHWNPVLVIEYSAYQEAVAQAKGSKAETKIAMEVIEKLKAEIESLDQQCKSLAVENLEHNWPEVEANRKIDSLNLLAESYRSKLAKLVSQLELVDPISAHVEQAFNEARAALEAK